MITDADIQACLDFLRDNATQAAKARATRVYVEEYRKTIKAQQMAAAGSLPVTAQEREAYMSEPYVAHLEAIREAVYEDERQRWLMIGAQAKIDAWRTQQANHRAETRL
jgi:hypothetical protein